MMMQMFTGSTSDNNETVQATTCKCLPGYAAEFSGADCKRCPYAFYSDGTQSECQECPENSFTLTTGKVSYTQFSHQCAVF
jgi:hypothetical protein